MGPQATLRQERTSMDESRLRLHILFQPLSILLLSAIGFLVGSTFLPVLLRFNLFQATFKFPYPLTTLAFVLLVVEAVLLLWAQLGKVFSRAAPEWAGLVFTSGPEFSTAQAWELLPTAAWFILTEVSIAVCLANFPMSTFVLLTSPSVLLQLALSDQTDLHAVASIVALFVGSVLVTYTTNLQITNRWTTMGLVSGGVAAVAIPLSNRSMKQASSALNDDGLKLLHYLLPLGLALLAPVWLLSGELFDIAANCYFLDAVVLWRLMAVIALSGLVYHVSRATVVGYVSPLTLAVLWQAKTAVVQTPVSERIAGSRSHWYCALGIAISILATAAYLLRINRHRPKFGLWFKT